MSYPTTSRRLPQWSQSPKRNQFRERRSLAESHGRPSAYDYRSHRAPSSHYVKRQASQGHPHSSPRSSSLLERIELPDRMRLNEEALNIRLNKDSSNPSRICGSQAQTSASPDFPRNVTLSRRTRPTVITRDLPSQTPLKIEESDSTLLSSAFEDGVISLLTTGFDMLREPLPELAPANSVDSASVIERCRQQLAPVLFMYAKSRDSSTNLDIKHCAAMLTDDHCCEFLRQARDMKLQMDALAPRPQDDSRVGEHINEENQKRRRSEDHHRLIPTACVRLGSRNDVISVISRRDSEATLVDSPIDHNPSTFAWKDCVQDLGPQGKQIIENGHNHSSTDIQTSPIVSIPHQTALLPLTATLEDAETITCPPADSRPTPIAAPQGMATCSSAAYSPASSSSTTMQSLSTPGTWLKRQGLTRPGILDIEFMVEENPIPATSPSSALDPLSTVQLSCFREDLSHELQEGDNLDAMLHKIENQDWPTKGFLVVQLNIESPNGRSWLPYQLEKGPLNVTSSLVPGKNTMRLIHLGDISKFVFIVYALPGEVAPLKERWRQPGWASKVTRPEIPSNTSSTILKYATIPITFS